MNYVSNKVKSLILNLTLLATVFTMPVSAFAAWDLSAATYDSALASFAGCCETTPFDVIFRSDGTSLYIVGNNGKRIQQISLSTPWDLTTNVPGSFFAVNGQDTSPIGLFFKSDGTEIYMMGGNTDTIYKYSLGTPWDISTASYGSVSFSVTTQDSIPVDLFFSSDGTKMYIIGFGGGNKINQYSLSSAWNITTASHQGSVTITQDGAPYDLFFKSDGSKLFVLGFSNDRIYQYSLTTPWDITAGVSYDGSSLYYGGQAATSFGFSMKTDGSKAYVMSGIGNLYQYSTGNPDDATAPTVSTLSPADGATGVSTTANLVITFDEAVDPEAGASNDIVIYKASDDSVVETIDAQDAKVTGGNSTTITIDPAATLTEQTSYYVQIGADAFDDTAGNSYAGISNTTSWNFTTGDFTNPTVSTLSPLDNAVDVAIDSNLVLTFSEIVDVESGNITIKKSSDNSTVETIAVGSTTGTGTTTITINPTNDLNYETEFYVNIDATAFDDVNSNSYAGIADATTWSFTTEYAPVLSSGSASRSSSTPPAFVPPPAPPVIIPVVPVPSTIPVPPPAPVSDPITDPEPSTTPAPDSTPEPTPGPTSSSETNQGSSDSSSVRQPVFTVRSILKEIGGTAQVAGEFIREVAENPATKTVGGVAVVVPVAISTLILISSLVSGVPFLNYLFYLLVVIAQILGIKKNPKPWGTVYDSQTKRPIPFARVEILNGQNRKLQTTIADQNGRYGFLLSEELSKDSISLQAFRTKYDFPSKQVPTPVEQTLYPNIYQGGEINRVNNLTNFDIPMDPRSQSVTRNFYFGIISVKLNNVLTKVADVFFVAGVILGITNVIINPNGINFAIVTAIVLTYILRKSGFKLKPFGRTLDKQTNQILPFGFVSLHNQGGERVNFAVSDDQGRYFLLAPKGTYTLKVSTPAHISPTRVKEVPILTAKGWISKEIGI